MSKITVTRKNKGLTRTELRHRYFPWKLPRFLKVILDGVFPKFISLDKKILISNKVTSIALTDAFIIIYCNWDLLHARLNSHCKAWSYKKNKHKKIKACRKSL